MITEYPSVVSSPTTAIGRTRGSTRSEPRIRHRLRYSSADGVRSRTVMNKAAMRAISVQPRLKPNTHRLEARSCSCNAASGPIALESVAALQLHERASSLWVFGFSLGCTLIALIAALFMTVRERTPSADEYRRRWRIRGSDLVDPRVLPIAVVGLLTTLGYSVIMTFLPAYLVVLDMLNIASLFFLIWAFAMLVARLFAGRLHDHYGDNAVIPGALLSLTAGLVILALASADWHFIIAAVLGGFGHGAALPGIQTAGIKRTTSDRVPIATSTHYLALDSGLAIGPV